MEAKLEDYETAASIRVGEICDLEKDLASSAWVIAELREAMAIAERDRTTRGGLSTRGWAEIRECERETYRAMALMRVESIDRAEVERLLKGFIIGPDGATSAEKEG